MSHSKIRNGNCLCGSVKITSKEVGNSIGSCHCGMCRKWAGGPFLAVSCGSEVSFEGEDNIRVFKSSDWAERGFCRNCGSNLFYRLKESKKYFIPVGIFEEDEGFVFSRQVFIDEKPSYYSFSNETQNMTGAEAIAKFSSSKS